MKEVCFLNNLRGKTRLIFALVVCLILSISVPCFARQVDSPWLSINNVFTVEEFGAVGDGVTDDTQAIQAAITNMPNGSVLTFRAGAIYKVSETLTVDLSRIKGIVGNNATIITDLDIVVLHIQGGLTTGTATPETGDTSDEIPNMSVFIRDLQICSTPALSVGTGIKVTGTFGLRIEGCHIYGLNTGINITERNRNIVITGNHIWNCRSYCLHYYHANVHQSIINNNHMSYAKTVILFENGDVHNIQIVGNNLEGGYAQDNNHDNVIRIITDEPNTQISQVQIIGNSIEEHGQGTSLIQIYKHRFAPGELQEGEAQPQLMLWEIVGNELSGAAESNVELYNPVNGVISGNTLYSPFYGYSIKVKAGIEAVNISNNTFTAENGGNRFGGGLYVESDPNFPVPLAIGLLSFSSNIMSQQYLNPIVITTHPNDNRNGEIYETIIQGNMIQQAFNRGSKPEASVPLEGYAVDINITGNISSLLVNNNILRARAYNEHGIRVGATGTISNLIVKENIIRGLVERNGTSPIWFDLPSSNIIISSNIPAQ